MGMRVTAQRVCLPAGSCLLMRLQACPLTDRSPSSLLIALALPAFPTPLCRRAHCRGLLLRARRH